MFVGIDLGSRTIKVAALENGCLVDQQISESGFDPHGQALAMIARYKPTRVVATGYGRHLAQKHFADEVITEIKAHALGARFHFSECTTVVDIGGQDSKVISLGANGSVINFQMNDKCAAGTGKFLEIMAASLGFRLDEFGPAALGSNHEVAINSMCTVFAESEVISLKNHGAPPQDIARGVHLSVVNRIVAMLSRIGYGETIVFSGGVARNPCIVGMLRERLDNVRVDSPPAPDIVGALGAALHAAR
ncbi:MAG: 3-hydroxyacyl-ACP dehydratase [Anaerolineaceae bacterium]|nr:MAG: 3-hydroxyacyl-ACP dehydratase [Anaerolineaceae bacterium]